MFNAPPLIQVTPFNKYSNVFWCSSVPSSGSYVLTVKFSNMSYGYEQCPNCLLPYDVVENLTVKMTLPEDGANEHRNMSEY